MSHADGLSRLVFMHRTLSAVFAAGLAANGTFMLACPLAWYRAVPGVSETGPFNAHFVRDIGCAFLVSAIGFAWSAFDRQRARTAALVGSTFLCLHALVHLWDLVAGREAPHHLMVDFPAIVVPAALGLWLARPPSKATRCSPSAGRGLIARMIEPKLASFERDYDYDTTYLRRIAQTSGSAFLRFFLFSLFADHREETPAEAWFIAKLASVVREDCGPCTQLVVRMAEEHDVPADDIRGALSGDERAMSSNAALALRFTNAVSDRDILEASRLRAEVIERWGERALVTLAFAMASARVYPTIKYALGQGQACSRVTVAHEHVNVTKRALPSRRTANVPE
jgi:hypothetical protein